MNAIRVYSVDSQLDHRECMQALDAAGIYTMYVAVLVFLCLTTDWKNNNNSIDLSLPLNGSIDRVAPSWSTNILDLYTRTIDTFDQYDNVLAYNIGNEVVIETNTNVAPCQFAPG